MSLIYVATLAPASGLGLKLKSLASEGLIYTLFSNSPSLEQKLFFTVYVGEAIVVLSAFWLEIKVLRVWPWVTGRIF